jgi:hypothetical protein
MNIVIEPPGGTAGAIDHSNEPNRHPPQESGYMFLAPRGGAYDLSTPKLSATLRMKGCTGLVRQLEVAFCDLKFVAF